MADPLISLVLNSSQLGDISEWSQSRKVSAARALNFAADKVRTSSIPKMLEEVNFPSGYLMPSKGNFFSRLTANPGNLVASVTAKARATSLSRFAIAGKLGTPGIIVQVKKGHSVDMPKAFFMRLRAGQTLTETKNNLGVAVRLRPGDPLRNRRDMALPLKDGSNIYLLYGPSVDQVFRTLRDENIELAAQYMEDEFIRQESLLK